MLGNYAEKSREKIELKIGKEPEKPKEKEIPVVTETKKLPDLEKELNLGEIKDEKSLIRKRLIKVLYLIGEGANQTKKIMELSGLPRETVKHEIGVLIKDGFIVREGKGKNTFYRLSVDRFGGEVPDIET